MTAEDDESDQDIADDVLPPLVEEPAVPLKLDRLFPWHKPRKQFIRERQWIAYSRRLISELMAANSLPYNANGRREIRYLTLPGTDFLDVRLLSSVCGDLDCDLTTTGFLAGSEGNSFNARAQVRQEALVKAGYITDQSQTFWRRIEEISESRGAAIKELQNRSPFHIVNIDACGSLALPGADHAHRVIDAIYRIVETQLGRTTQKWLLFVTTDVRQENLHAGTLQRLTAAIRLNAAGSREFALAACRILGSAEAEMDESIRQASEDDGEHFLRLFVLGFAKWLIHLAGERNWSVRMHGCYYYSSAPYPHERPTMPCLAFEFLPPPAGLRDPLEVTNAQPAPGGTHANQSMRAIAKVQEMSDLDARLAQDPDLAQQLLSKTHSLLEEAGYPAATLSGLRELAGVA